MQLDPPKFEPSFLPERRVFRGEPTKTGEDRFHDFPAAPPWRHFGMEDGKKRGQVYKATPLEIEMVNAALYLRRPLLITGKPGVGKSSLAYAVAEELGLGPVLVWPINTHSTLREGLYEYDAIARLRDVGLARELSARDQGQSGNRSRLTASTRIGRYIRLGALGTAFATVSSVDGKPRPRILLIDEIDKSDVDLPNNLLNIFEEGSFEILELSRLPNLNTINQIDVGTHDGGRTSVKRGRVTCDEFPLVIMTSNGEREFPPAFLRRCLRLNLDQPDLNRLKEIVGNHFSPEIAELPLVKDLLERFVAARDEENQQLATDQLLNAVYMVTQEVDMTSTSKQSVPGTVFQPLADTEN